MNSKKVQTALSQWRESLIQLSSRNKLLNYKKTRSSTIEFAGLSAADVFDRLNSKTTTYVVGTKPEPAKYDQPVEEEELEDLLLDEIEKFDYSQHKDSLFSEVTQREVDRILKTISSAARREFLDKGISPLYLALGALHWIDEGDDHRVSPLILVPVELHNNGPREPLQLSRADDDVTINPALTLKLNEFGITLPSSDSVLEALEDGGVTKAIGLFESLTYPVGWEVRDLAVLSLFAFQKEAMYRDLLDNEKEISESPIIQALSGGSKPEESQFFFDPIDQELIDEAASPETTSLVLDADSSQRAAVAAAVSGSSFVLDGPPGTGKSQTIANIIGALIDQGKSVLFVSEKIVALEVVRDRLNSRGLGAFLFELHSHKTTRKEVAKQLGQALRQNPVPPSGMSKTDLTKARNLRESLNDYARAMNEIREPLNASVFEVLGLLEDFYVELATPNMDADALGLTPETLDSIRDSVARVGRHWELHVAGRDATWFGLERREELAFQIDAAISALSKYQENYFSVLEAAMALQLNGTFDGANLHDVLQHWSTAGADRSERWLTLEDLSDLEKALETLSEVGGRLQDVEAKCMSLLGSNWREIQPVDPIPSTVSFPALNKLLPRWTELSLDRFVELSEMAGTSIQTIKDSIPEIQSACISGGISQPKSISEVRSLVSSLEQLASAEVPPTAWLTSRKAYKIASESSDQLRKYVENVRTAESRTELFTQSVLLLDLPELADFFAVNTGFLKRFSNEYRSRKKAILACSKHSNWKDALRDLPFALDLSESISKLREIESINAEVLGGLYSGLSTDWDRIHYQLLVSDVLLNGFTVEDPDSFGENLEKTHSSSAPESPRKIGAELVSAWNSVLDSVGGSSSQSLENIKLVDLGSELGSLLNDIIVVREFLSDSKNHLPTTTTINTFFEGIAAVGQMVAVRMEATVAIEASAGYFDEPIDSSEIMTSEFFDAARRKITWARKLRNLVSRVSSEGIGESPLSESQLDALRNSELPSEFIQSYEAWQRAWSQLRSSFNAEVALGLDRHVEVFESAKEYLAHLRLALGEVEAWFDLNKSKAVLSEAGLERALEAATEQQLGAELAPKFIISAALRTWISTHFVNDPRLNEDPTFERSHFVEQYRDLDKRLRDNAVSQIVRNGSARRPKSSDGQAGLIEREAEKKTRHIAVRELINRSRDVIQSIHPCFMMSPLAVSQYLPADIRFDVVIFDEASQVTPADSINCIYRGHALITAGDQKQLPPMTFFASSGIDDESLEEDVAGDYDSVLDLMKASGSFNSLTLNWHYRSRHEHLIAYSNAAFYGSRLITFPGAISESDDLGIKFLKVDGIYRRSSGATNPIEAKEVAKRVIHHYETRPGQSLGVVAFSTAQRDEIENAVQLEKNRRPELVPLLEGSRQDGFFVNSLEAVQGDERDVIIFSIGYGPDESGKIYKNFGPLNRAGGERRLNVAITRARRLVEIVTSMTASDLGEVNSEGARHLRRYLDFAERGPSALALELGESGLGTDSPFEDSVIDAIRSWGYEVQPQVGVAGYRIDIGVKHPNSSGVFILGVECDGAMYHSSKAARDRDRLRHEILEGLGWRIHHIWGTAWYRHRQRELDRLKEVIDYQAAKPVTGRSVLNEAKKLSAVVDIEYEESLPKQERTWITEYQVAEPKTIPSWVDLSDTDSAWQLRDFVREVLKVEQPIHEELLIKRLRSSSEVSKVGNRIRETLNWALDICGVEREGEFLWKGSSRKVKARRPGEKETREIGHVAPEELRVAVMGVVSDARGIARSELTLAVARVFGWARTSAQIESRIGEEIDHLVGVEKILASERGYRLP